MNNPISQQELFTFTELIKSYKSRLKELTEENTELKNIITNGKASNNDLTNQITLLQNKYDEYVKNNPANEIYNEEQLASVAGDKITKLKKIISIKNDEIEKYKKEKSQLLIKLNEANYTIDKLKSQNSINESYKDDNTKLRNRLDSIELNYSSGSTFKDFFTGIAAKYNLARSNILNSQLNDENTDYKIMLNKLINDYNKYQEDIKHWISTNLKSYKEYVASLENSSNENFDIINKFIDICKIYENIIITYYRYKNKESQHSAKVRLDEFKEDNNINITNPTLLPRKVDIQDPPVKDNVSKETLQNSITDVERDIQKDNNVSTFKRTNTTDSDTQSKSKRIN